ncbi:MAG: hypothetical protein LBN29_07850 [Mediterranea sp.]|nr:hypothetical protein [Mediterranea sp.]
MKASTNGIEMSTDRYLTDNATGLFFLMNALILIKLDVFPDLSAKLLYTNTYLNVFGGVILFLSSTAIGLIISTFSYLILEWIYIGFEYLWWRLKWPLFPIQFKKEFKTMVDSRTLFANIIGKERVKYGNWHYVLVMAEEELIESKINIDRFLLQRGIRVLLRNISFILLIDLIILLLYTNTDCCLMIGVSIAMFIFMLVAGYIGFFANVGLMNIYKLYKRRET